ncbi:MAG: universal stress protein, partial [Deltaproteobacteria bacterium]|nr:universal stress protein [Deltaproteobacteria bacterium]
PNMHFVLLHILPQVPPLFREKTETDSHIFKKMKKLEATHRERGHEVLEKAKHHLVKHHVDPSRIEIRIRKRYNGVIKDIINEAHIGMFDALVVGRRGMTRTQELFMGSVSSQLIQHITNIPLWIVDGQVSQPKVLIAVDGSPAGRRAVEYVAFILGKHPEAEASFLHVVPTLQPNYPVSGDYIDGSWASPPEDLTSIEADFLENDDAQLHDFLKTAIDILSQAGFTRERIRIEYREITLGIARTIINAAKEGGYGTIVLGRRGLGKSSFLGSVTDRVIRRVEDVAVWLIN